MTPPRLRLRPAEPADRELLLRVYASTRAEELAPVPWSAGQKAAFLRFQFEAQDAHYRAHYDGCEYLVILADEAPAGRLYVHRRPDEIRLVDIALLPPWRGAGIGGRLLADLLAEARARGVPVRIHVEQQNRARGLYARLGFRPLGEHGVYVLMEWTPAPAG